MEIEFRDLQLIFQYNTTVRIKSTGEYVLIVYRCWCCDKLPLHYEAWFHEKEQRLGVVFQEDIELVSLPPHALSPEERKKFIYEYAEIVANVILKDFERSQT